MYEVEVTWEELVEEFQKIPEEMLLEEVEHEAKKFSPDVLPEGTELILRLRRIELKLKDKESFPYKNILEKNSKIIVESPQYPGAIPIVYVCLSKKRGGLSGKAELLLGILCSKIYVRDKELYENKEKLMVLLLFYMEYPLRAERLGKESLLSKLLQIITEKKRMDR